VEEKTRAFSACFGGEESQTFIFIGKIAKTAGLDPFKMKHEEKNLQNFAKVLAITGGMVYNVWHRMKRGPFSSPKHLTGVQESMYKKEIFHVLR